MLCCCIIIYFFYYYYCVLLLLLFLLLLCCVSHRTTFVPAHLQARRPTWPLHGQGKPSLWLIVFHASISAVVSPRSGSAQRAHFLETGRWAFCVPGQDCVCKRSRRETLDVLGFPTQTCSDDRLATVVTSH